MLFEVSGSAGLEQLFGRNARRPIGLMTGAVDTSSANPNADRAFTPAANRLLWAAARRAAAHARRSSPRTVRAVARGCARFAACEAGVGRARARGEPRR